MAQYETTSSNSLTFELSKEQIQLGKLTYKSWFKFSAIMELNDFSQYTIEPKGFWGTTIELKDGETVLLTFKMNWNGQIIIQSFFGGVEKDFIFKHRGVFKESYVLTEPNGVELFVMKSKMKWNKMRYEFDVTTSDEFELLKNKKILLMISIHCANYYLSLMAG